MSITAKGREHGPFPYNLLDWRVDCDLNNGNCTCSDKPIEHTPNAPNAGWCEICGNWYDDFYIGWEDPQIMHYLW